MWKMALNWFVGIVLAIGLVSGIAFFVNKDVRNKVNDLADKVTEKPADTETPEEDTPVVVDPESGTAVVTVG